MSVRNYVKRSVRTVSPYDSLQHAAQEMMEDHVGCLVVQEAGKVLGVVTDRDLALQILCDGLDPNGSRVQDLKLRKPITISEDASLAEAVEKIRIRRIRRLPVVDRHGHLRGILSSDDLLMLFSSELQTLSEAVQRQLPQPDDA